MKRILRMFLCTVIICLGLIGINFSALADSSIVAPYLVNEMPMYIPDTYTKAKYISPADKNLLENGGFEGTGGPMSDSLFSPYVTQTNDSFAVHSGTKGAVFSTVGIRETKASFTINVEENTDYLFGMWIRSKPYSNDNTNVINWGITIPNTDNFVLKRDIPAADGAWHLVGYSFNSGSYNTLSVAILGTQTALYIDDMFLCKTADMVRYVSPEEALKEPTVTNSNPELLGCKSEDNLFGNYSFSEEEDSFWYEENGSVYGNQVFIDSTDSEIYGKALHYIEGKNPRGNPDPSGAYYIKWVEVEPNTEYTFSADYAVIESCPTNSIGTSYFGFITGNRKLPTKILGFNILCDNNEKSLWKTASASFNTGDYSRIAFVVLDCGGEAYIDNIRLFKTEKATEVINDVITYIDFEDGTNKFNGENSIINSGYAHTGNKSLYITLNEALKSSYYKIEKNTSYTVGFWYRGTPGDTVLSIYVATDGNGAGNKELTELNFWNRDDIIDGWAYSEISFISGGYTYVQLSFEGTAEYPFYVDDIKLAKEVTRAPASILTAIDFEDNVRVFTNGDGANNSANISTENTYSGNKSLCFTPEYKDIKARSRFYSVEKNTDYTVSFWYKGTPGWAVVRIGAEAENGNINYTYTQSEKLGTDEKISEWTYFEFTFNSGENIAIDIAFALGSQAKYTFYVDDVKLFKNKEIFYVSGNIFPDGSFESGSLSNWEIANGIASISKFNPHSGSNSLLIDCGERWSRATRLVEVEPYTDYDLSFFYSGNAAWEHVVIRTAENVDIHDQIEINKDDTFRTEQREFTCRFNSGNNTQLKIGFRQVAKSTSNRFFYVDDICLKEAEVKIKAFEGEKGSVGFSGSVKGGDKVTLDVNADSGYKVNNIKLAVDTETVINQDKESLVAATPVVDNRYTFTMPAMNVSITADFTELTDMNYDGTVNILDFIALKKLIIKESAIIKPADDLDGSGALDSGDLVIVCKYILSK